MRIMNKIFAEYLDDFIVVFIDDILIYSRTMKDHLLHLRKALEVLRKHGFKAKLKKCQFGLPQVEFLGHEISEAGLSLPAPLLKPSWSGQPHLTLRVCAPSWVS
jgi:hypothetical protein